MSQNFIFAHVTIYSFVQFLHQTIYTGLYKSPYKNSNATGHFCGLSVACSIKVTAFININCGLSMDR